MKHVQTAYFLTCKYPEVITSENCYLLSPMTGFMGLYGSYKVTRGPATLMTPFSKPNKRADQSMMRLSRDNVSLEARLANMICFWAVWHVAWVVKSIPFFKMTMGHVTPKYLLIEIVVMMFCLNCWFVPFGAPAGYRVGVSTIGHQG